MKRIELIITGFLLMGATACKKDFIEQTPVDAYTVNNFYKTEAQFQSAIVAAYAPLRDVLVNDYFTSEMHSDNTIYQPYADQGTAYSQRRNIADFTNTSTNAYANATWQHSYTGISRCNTIIESLPFLETISSDSVRKSIDGQAKFLRALNYYKLVQLYGAVPLFLKVITKADDAFIPRTAVDTVYQQIIADAKDAIDELALPKFAPPGTATKGAATMLLADVYSQQKRWSEVEALLNTLPAMGYSLYANYGDAFLPANNTGKESIFAIQFFGGTATGTTPNATTLHFIPRSKNTGLLTGIDKLDNTGSGGWNTPSSDLIAAYEPNDARLDSSIGIIEGTYDGSYYMTYSAVKSIVNYKPAAGKIGIPYIKKYLHSPLPASTGSSDDFPIYRYSEALLLLAEALNEQGKSADALVPLNKVRTRAGITTTTTTDQAQLRNIIWHERRVELAFENHRWEDLLRSGKTNALAVINAFGVKIRQEVSYLPTDSHVVNEHNLLFPIPQGDLDLNKLLEPNP
ncbi:carbohydrate-binding protein SusD [Niastella yeongjuensis]|uniref:Carbohydrate-binding protein SusD n=1 Tax=Niastella yeongjuensis TaxID=354355 RepID=A0A1V9EMU4_9BACT|nr:RagB/SusD family nutrient uptake outer membrane protein [Niastella yeongjuensis]OQP47446.1 carbohydrate-binding protein SusD [Niastella yeongjuensis]SEN84563.1 Starch-binding associating with outer membrane [Niastella yeongjuensis]